MKRYINLLPPEEQKQIAKAAVAGEILRFGIWFLVSLMALWAVLFAAQVILGQHLERANAALAEKNAALLLLESSQVRRDVITFNLDLQNFIAATGGEEARSEMVADFQALLPAGMTVDQMTITSGREGSRIEVSGRGGNRAAVLRLRDNILASESFRGVNFPLKNLERAVDAPWSYRFYAKQ